VQVADVHTQLHRRRTEKGCEFTPTETAFALLPNRRRNLSRVRSAFDANQTASGFSVQLSEELVRLSLNLLEPLRAHPLGSDRIWSRRRTIPKSPLERSSQ